MERCESLRSHFKSDKTETWIWDLVKYFPSLAARLVIYLLLSSLCRPRLDLPPQQSHIRVAVEINIRRKQLLPSESGKSELLNY